MTAVATEIALSVPRADLVRSLRMVAPFVASRAVIPALTSVLLEVVEGEVVVTANDSSATLTTRVTDLGTDVLDDWAAVIPAGAFTDYVGSLSASEVTLTLKSGRRLEVTSGASHALFPLIDPDDYPRPRTDTDWEISLPSALWREALGQVCYAAARDDKRPVLGGVQVRLDGMRCTLAGANGVILATRDLELLDATPTLTEMVVPVVAMEQMAKILPATEGATVTIGGDKHQRQAVFTWDGCTLTSRLIEGQYPDYHRVIPASPPHIWLLEPRGLLEALKSALVAGKEDSNFVQFRLQGDSVLVCGKGIETGSELETRVAVRTEGTPIDFATNGRQLADMVAQVLGTVELGLTSPSMPIRVRPLGRTDLTMVIQPMYRAGGAVAA